MSTSFLTRHDSSLGYTPLPLPESTRPTLFVIVDTEEEFDWAAPFSRNNQQVRAVRHIGRLQRILERYRVRPTYVVDYPVASNPDAYGPIKEFVDSGVCAVGAHLHPWVNPPFWETIDRRNSFACNLGADLEAAKVRVLQSEIAENIGTVPRVYKAGRYGFGPSTVGVLERLEFDIDVSINPHMDFSADGGPSFGAFDAKPFFFGRNRCLLELPCSTGHAGVAAHAGPLLNRVAASPAGRALHLGGVLSRLGIAERILLSPEQSTTQELQRLTHALLAQGVRTFAFTFHSPSLDSGHTPYVRTPRELARFLDRIEQYCEFFCGALAGVATTPEEFMQSVQQPRVSEDGTVMPGLVQESVS